MSRKAILVTNIPTPYRIPLFNEVSRQLASHDVDFKVVFGARGYARRKWQIDMSDCAFEYEVLEAKAFRWRGSEGVNFTYPGITTVLKKDRPFVVVASGFSVATTKLWLGGYKYIIWSGSRPRKNREDSYLRRLQRRALVRRAVGFVTYGKQAQDYLVSIGAKREDVHIAINTVDTRYFADRVATYRQEMEKDTEKRHLLFVGDLVPRKSVDTLLEAVAILAGARSDFVLHLVGAGDQEETLKQQARELGLDGIVHFEGFKQRDDVARYLAQADCFVFPTRYDVWGLVLVEAMAAGLTSLSSIEAGATSDLIRDGETGFAVDFSNTKATADQIGWVLDHPEQRARIGSAAAAHISEHVNLQKSAEGFVNAIKRQLPQ